jgi:sterol desaturase/sphingolipid hydroxylase (fatty acid hydroxylase superfamily)
VHAVHHRSADVNPFTSYSINGVEALLLGAWIVPAVVFLPVPMAAIGVLQVVGLANNVMSHLGYEFLPRWIMRAPLLRWTNTATFHSLHHSHPRSNFGLHTRVWDRLFGTELPEYEAIFLRRGAEEPRAE